MLGNVDQWESWEVTHDLRTPLTVIKACIEALMDGAVDDPNVRRPFLEQIHEQGERLHALILDLIHLARIESGESPLDIQPTEIGPPHTLSCGKKCGRCWTRKTRTSPAFSPPLRRP